MAAGKHSRSFTWRFGTSSALALTIYCGSASAGRIQGVSKSPPVINATPDSLVERVGTQPSGGEGKESWVSFGAFASRDDREPTSAVRSAPEIPWTNASVDAVRVPISTPDWRLMPKVRTGADGKAYVQRVRTSPALAALRGEQPAAPGSVFSTGFGTSDTPPPAPEPDTEHLDDDGKPVFAAPTKYFQDFEDQTVAREWRLAGLEEMDKFGRFAGPFRNSTQTLFVQCEPDTPYVVTFDLLFIAANLGDPAVSDLFSVEVDGQALLEDTFVVLRERNETYNSERDDFDRDIYKQVAVTFTPRGDGVVKIKFKSAAHGAPGGETWGLDNVHIDIAPRQTLGELTHDDAGLISATGALGGFGLATNNGAFDNEISYFRGDPSLRPNGPSGPTVPPNIPVPTPGAGALLAAGLLALTRRRR
ncbi:MAG: hypothetical protein ACKVZJ_00765 [Phycisphaerales bacterium]